MIIFRASIVTLDIKYRWEKLTVSWLLFPRVSSNVFRMVTQITRRAVLAVSIVMVRHVRVVPARAAVDADATVAEEEVAIEVPTTNRMATV